MDDTQKPSSQPQLEASMQNVQVEKAMVFIKEAILEKRININDPIRLIDDAYRLVMAMSTVTNASLDDKRKIAFRAIELIAAGNDGIAGTADDLIPKEIVDKIGVLINSGLLTSVIDVIAPAVVATSQKCFSACFSFAKQKVSPQ